jgi:hypothetical protein
MVVDQRGVRITALLVAALVGGGLGFLIGRGTVSNSETVATLSNALVVQQRVSAAAPIIANSITAASALIGSCLSSCAVWWVIHWTGRKEGVSHEQQ